MANHFKSLFNIVRENESVAELPVVLEVSLNTTDSTATPTEGETTPSVTPDPVATENEGAGAVVTDVDETITDSQGTVGDVETDEISEQIIATEDEVAMAEQVTKNEEISNEITNAVEVNDDMQEQVAVQEEVLENPETITPATVAVAAESFMACAKRLDRNFERSDFTSLQQISVESFISKENNGQGLNPAMALSIVHEDMKSFGNKVVETIKKLFAMLKEGLKKVWEFIVNLFSNYSKIATKLQARIKEVNSNMGEVDLYKLAPICAKYSKIGANEILNYAKHQVELVKVAISANNVVANIKIDADRPSNNAEETKKKLNNDMMKVAYSNIFKVMEKIIIKTDGGHDAVLGYGGSKYITVDGNFNMQDLNKYEDTGGNESMHKFKFTVKTVESTNNSKKVAISKDAVYNALNPIADNTVSKQLQELKKVSSNIGVLESKFGKLKSIDSSIINMIQQVLGVLPNAVAKVSSDGAKTVIKIANAFLSGDNSTLVEEKKKGRKKAK